MRNMKQTILPHSGIITALALTLLGTPVHGENIAVDEAPVANAAETADVERLYTLEGTDPTREELFDSGAIVIGESLGDGPVPGARVVVNYELLETLTGPLAPLDTANISGIQHFAGHGNRAQLNQNHWARWYQEDGKTQIFRVHEGDWQFRDPDPAQAIPGRIEAYTKSLKVEPGTWREWEGTLTIIKPHGGTIFQMFHEGGQLWAFHLGMDNDGKISFGRRWPKEGEEKHIVLAENMVGKPLSIRVRNDGHHYEIYKKRPLIDEDWELVTAGSFKQAKDDKIQFRWGWYLGRNPKGRRVANDAMYFVSGTTVRTIPKKMAAGIR